MSDRNLSVSPLGATRAGGFAAGGAGRAGKAGADAGRLERVHGEAHRGAR